MQNDVQLVCASFFFALNAHNFEVIPAGGFGDWNRLDQVLPYHKVQRNANQDL